MTGTVLWEYRAPKVHPIVYALALVTAMVGLTGSLEVVVRRAEPHLFAVYWAPLAVVVVAGLLTARRPVRIHADGIEPGGLLVLPVRRLRWNDLAAVYPVSYDVTGAFVSPFASSDGKVTQTGIGLEGRDGRLRVVAFTPSRFALNARKSRGFRDAWATVTRIFEEQGRTLVPAPPRLSPEERQRLLVEARRPFLPFFVIVFLFASAAPIVWGLMALQVEPPLAVAVGLAAPLATSLTSWRRSRARNRILNLLHKAAMGET